MFWKVSAFWLVVPDPDVWWLRVSRAYGARARTAASRTGAAKQTVDGGASHLLDSVLALPLLRRYFKDQPPQSPAIEEENTRVFAETFLALRASASRGRDLLLCAQRGVCIDVHLYEECFFHYHFMCTSMRCVFNDAHFDEEGQ